MDDGTDAPAGTLESVHAYPLEAVTDFLAQLAQARSRLDEAVGRAQDRVDRARVAIEQAAECHRLLGLMMIDCQREISQARADAEATASAIVAAAEEEAQRILARPAQVEAGSGPSAVDSEPRHDVLSSTRGRDEATPPTVVSKPVDPEESGRAGQAPLAIVDLREPAVASAAGRSGHRRRGGTEVDFLGAYRSTESDEVFFARLRDDAAEAHDGSRLETA